jgi:hypothetical protein
MHGAARSARLVRRWPVALVLFVFASTPAIAEVRVWGGRPPRGLFHASHDPENAKHRLDLSLTGFVGYERVRYESQLFEVFGVDELVGTGVGGGGSAHATYAFKGENATFSLVGGGWFRRSSGLPDVSYPAGYQGLGFGTPIGPRTRLRLQQGFAYSPYYAFTRVVDPSRDPEALAPIETELFAERRANYTYNGSFEVSHNFTARSMLTVGVSGRYVDFRTQGYDYASERGFGRYSRGMTRHSTLHAGYAFNRWHYPGLSGVALHSHDLYAGVAYSRPLAQSRRTRVGFDLNSSIVGQQTTNSFRVNGHAFVTHQIARTWAMAGWYRRNVDVVEGLAAPYFYFYDVVAASVSGNITRRITFSSVGSWDSGQLLVDPFENRVRSLNGSATVSTTLFSRLSTWVSGGVGSYDFERQLGLLRTTPVSTGRAWVRVGLTLWAPLVT